MEKLMHWVSLVVLLFGGQALAAEGREYALGGGDVVRISVYEQPDLQVEERINSDGFVSFPLLGRIKLGGLTATAAAQQVARELERQGFVRRAHVSLRVTEFNSLQVSVLGEVQRAGRIVLDRPSTLPEVLALAGGIAPSGGHRVVLLRIGADNRQQRYEHRLADLLQADQSGRSRLWVEAGDVIFVPPAGQFYIHGQVNTPGVYRLDRELNVMQAVSMGGGFNQRANQRGLELYRQEPDGSVRKMKARPEQVIKDGDVLFVRESLF